jgi:16S rRNA (guanine(1405)-N(7))-methyltransferase
MPLPRPDPDFIEEQVDLLLQSKKYRQLEIPRETLRDIILNELGNHRNSKDALKSVRHKLHTVIAPYLGDPDYDLEQQQMESVFQRKNPAEIKAYCRSILEMHASTRERNAILEEFYAGIFAHTGTPTVILDLACGLNPFSLPWMNLPSGVRYYAYDIHQPRLNLINHFFSCLGMEPLAEKRDILLAPPDVEADVAFLFKETHRLEQRRRGCNLPLWQALKVRHLLVSLPASSLSGQHDLVERQRHLIQTIVGDQPWQVIEMNFGNEMVFCIEK